MSLVSNRVKVIRRNSKFRNKKKTVNKYVATDCEYYENYLLIAALANMSKSKNFVQKNKFTSCSFMSAAAITVHITRRAQINQYARLTLPS